MKKPNILLVMSDQHAACFTGCYGNSLIKTPNLDRLAQQGVLFRNAYCNSPLCVPSRMSFMTGKHVQNIGIWDNNIILPSEERTFAHHLKNAGYDVVLSGKMHFFGPDTLHGFDAQLARDLPAEKDVNASAPVPNWAGGGKVRGHGLQKLPHGEGVTEAAQVDYLAEETASEFIQSSERQENPWAVVVGIYSPHRPWVVEQRYLDLYSENDIPLPNIPKGHIQNQHPVHHRNRKLRGMPSEGFDDDTIKGNRRAYFALISRVDEQLGRLWQAVEASGQADNTVIVYTSDHGEMMGEHGLWMKSSMYDQNTAVPLIISCPNQFTTGHEVNEVVSLVDLSATLIDLGGESECYQGDGNSLLPFCRGKSPPDWKNEALCEHYATWVDRPLVMLRQGPYKLMQSFGEPPELYHLDNDPDEFENLASDPKHTAHLKHLQAELTKRWNGEHINQTVLASQADRLAKQ